MIIHSETSHLKRVWHRFKRFLKPRRPDSKPTVADRPPGLAPTHQSENSVSIPVPPNPGPSKSTPLEDLPAEIRRHLLSILDYERLKCLVHTSPIYHQQYLLDRQYILCKSLENTLGSSGLITDACAIYQSGLLNLSETNPKEKITRFLRSYQDCHSIPSSQFSFLMSLPVDEVISIGTFHRSVIKPLSQEYAGWAQGNLTNETTTSTHNYQPLSSTEETRIVRALYRFELYCTLFGVRCYRSNHPQWFLELKPMDILMMFLEIYEPWEVEEIICIYIFVKKNIDQVFHEIYWDVHPDNPKLEGHEGDSPPTRTFDFDRECQFERLSISLFFLTSFDYLSTKLTFYPMIGSRDNYLEGTVSLGLGLLSDVLFKSNDHADLVSTMEKQIALPRSFTFPDILRALPQSRRQEECPSDRDLKQNQRTPLPFQGDAEDLPPLAWILIWRGTYSSIFGWCISDILRFWGYIMWDAARLEYTGAKELLAQQWERRWGDMDPRDD